MSNTALVDQTLLMKTFAFVKAGNLFQYLYTQMYKRKYLKKSQNLNYENGIYILIRFS